MSFDSYDSNGFLPPPDLAVRKVSANCHISFDGVYYSTPHSLYGQMVFVRADKFSVDILDYNGTCVASHVRCFVKRKYITDPSHMPKFYYSIFHDERYDGAKLRKWAQDIGVNTYKVIDSTLSNKQIEEHAYRSCMAILQLSKKYGNPILEKACVRALDSGFYNFYTIKKLAEIEYDRDDNNSPLN